MSHGFYEVSRGGGDKASDTLSRHKPDPVFVAATIAQHKTELRSRLANSLRFSKGHGLDRPQHVRKRKSSPIQS